MDDGFSKRTKELAQLALNAVEEKIPFNKIRQYLKLLNLDEIVNVRAQMVERIYGCDFAHIRGKTASFQGIKEPINDENFVGTIQIPVGIVGPVSIKQARHLDKKELTYLLATTEKSLIAGANAAAKIVNEAGGVEVQASPEKNLIARSSAFIVKDFPNIHLYLQELQNLLDDHEKIEMVVREGYGKFKGSEHAKFVGAEVFSEDNFLYVRYTINPGDAAGHNMVTKTAFTLNNHLIEEMKKKGFALEHLILSGGLCKDKNTAAINYERGIKVQARVSVPHEVCRKFGIDPEKTITASFAKNYLGQSIAGGLRGNNSSIANTYTAMSIAYGQDVANAVEASQARTIILPEEGALRYSINGSVVCGTLGGGTIWPCQREALEMLGVRGSDAENPGLYKARFAEAMGVAFLLSEIAVHRSLMTGEDGSGSRHFKSHNGKMRKKK